MNIFHYTSIKNLALILKGKKMRFTRLDKVNDPYDGIVNDYSSSQKLVYVSCFTKREDDSFPMWAMYTNNMDGVRIKFNQNLFGEIETSFWGGFPSRERKIKISKSEEIRSIFGPILIEYKESLEEASNLEILSKGPRFQMFLPLHIGSYKMDDWSFEEEVRYKVLSFNAMIIDEIEGSKMEKVNEYIFNDTEWILLDLSETALKNAEILLGPNTEEADEIIVKALVERYEPSIKVRKSKKKFNNNK